MDDDEIVAVALDRRRVDVALAELNVLEARLIDAGAGERQHRGALVDADRADRARSEELQHPPRPGSEIEQIAERRFPEHVDQRRLDPILGGVQGADAVPVGGLLGEIGGGLPTARLAGDLEPGAVGGQRRVGRIEPAHEIAGERAAASARRKNAQAPSRWRSASPASTRSFKWRDTRGCDWPRMATSSLTVSSASSSRQRMRSRVSSPAASSPASRVGKEAGSDRGAYRSLDINISLCLILRSRKGQTPWRNRRPRDCRSGIGANSEISAKNGNEPAGRSGARNRRAMAPFFCNQSPEFALPQCGIAALAPKFA